MSNIRLTLILLLSASVSHEQPSRCLGKGSSGRLYVTYPGPTMQVFRRPPRRMTEHRSTIFPCGGAPNTRPSTRTQGLCSSTPWMPVLQPARIVSLLKRSLGPGRHKQQSQQVARKAQTRHETRCQTHCVAKPTVTKSDQKCDCPMWNE